MGGGGEGRKEARKLPGGLRDFCHAPSAAVVAAKGRARSAGGGSAPRWRQPQFLLQLPHLRSPATPCGRRASAAAAVSDSPGRGGARRASPVFYFILYFIFFWLMIMILYLSLPHRQHAVYLPSPPPTHARILGGGFAAERFSSCSPPLACGAIPQEGGAVVAPSPSRSLHLPLFAWRKCPRGGGFPAAAVAVPPRVPVGSGGDCGVPRSLPCPHSTAPGALPFPRTAAAPFSPSSALWGGGTATPLPPPQPQSRPL